MKNSLTKPLNGGNPEMATDPTRNASATQGMRFARPPSCSISSVLVACRTAPVHGLVLIALNDAPGSARLVVGAGDWRWSDLLGAHGGALRR